MWQLSFQAQGCSDRQLEYSNRVHHDRGIDPIQPHELDLLIFGALPFGHPCKYEFLLRCYGHQWPDIFEIEKDGVKNHWVIDRAIELCREKFLCFMGCASSGKSYDTAAYIYTQWKSRPRSTSAYVTTTSKMAGDDRSWGVVKALHSKDRYKVGKRIESLSTITLDEELRDDEGVKERDVRDAIKVVAIKQGADGRNVMQAIVGRKNDRVIWLADEFQFLDLGVLDARLNLMANPFFQFIGLGNGPREGDPLYLDAEPFGDEHPGGWKSVSPDTHKRWRTRAGVCLYFDGHKSPNLGVKDENKPPFKSLLSRSRIEDIKRVSGGEDTPMYWNQVRGFPPSVDVPDKIITHALLETNGAFGEVIWEGSKTKVLGGLDLGFRAEGDPCVIDFVKVGVEMRDEKGRGGKTVASHERDAVVLNPKQSDAKDFETQIAHRVIEECKKRDCRDISLDVSGDGGMILQAVERVAREQNYQLNVLPVSFSGQAEDRVVIPGERRTAREMFDRMVSQIWGVYRTCVINGVIRNANPHSLAVNQLCSRKFNTDEKKRMSVEKKSDMKKRIKRSPDHADARCLAIHLALRHGLSGAEAPAPQRMERATDSQETQRGYSQHSQRAAYSTR